MATHFDLDALNARLQSIVDRALNYESRYGEDIAAAHPEFRESARNLVHYLALRQSDIRDLQDELAALGLTSLGQAENNVLGSIRIVQKTLHRIAHDADFDLSKEQQTLARGARSAESHSRAILGRASEGRDVGIMVTLPGDAGGDHSLIADMIAAGMNIARINCGHDHLAVWKTMVAEVRRASAAADNPCRVVMDLAGAKLRTGSLEPGPRVLHIRPRRDPLGRVIAARRLRLIPDDMAWPGRKTAVIPVPRECIEFARPGDELRFKDTRGKKRKLKVVLKDERGLVLETWRGAYILSGARLRLIRKDSGEELTYRIGRLPAIEQPILLRVADRLILHREAIPGAPAKVTTGGKIKRPAHIACQQPEALEHVSEGDPVWLNDGKIGGVVRVASKDGLEIEITHAKPTGSRLRGNRSINFPNSDLHTRGLTRADKANLDFIVEHADAISLSFVREPNEIVSLQQALQRCARRAPGLIVKIETEQGFRNLPRLLLAAMRAYPAAIMIARGDLAIECGWERLAEIQEEILWLCEAARMPVIWATQVLEREAKKGLPSRAEISDAAMSQRADCVMLNKGPHILAAIRTLDDILRRMQNHQYKKSARLRKLSISEA